MKRSLVISLGGLLILTLAFQIHSAAALEGAGGLRRLRNGDVNGDGVRDMSDALQLLRHLFNGGPGPVESEDDPLPPEAVAAIIDSATRSLATLPTSEQLAKMPAKISNGFRRVATMFKAAVANAPSWGGAELRVYSGSVAIGVTLLDHIRPIICEFFPEACCPTVDECEEKLEACLASNPYPEGSFDHGLYGVNCYAAYLECLDCPD